MKKRRNILLIGGGGHCRSVIDVIEREGMFRIYGIIDKKSNFGKTVLGYKVIGTDQDIPIFLKRCANAHVTVGFITDPSKRKALFLQLKDAGAFLPAIISPHAYVSKHATVGEGSVVMHRALICAGASVGRNCIINSAALIEHDSVIGDHCHISTSATVNADCRIGSSTFISSHACVNRGIRVGSCVIAGAGCVITKQVKDNTRVIGVPAREVKNPKG